MRLTEQGKCAILLVKFVSKLPEYYCKSKKENTQPTMKNKQKPVLFVVLTVLQTAFIWCNSVLPPQESGALSGGVMQFVTNLLPVEEFIEPETLHHLIRKAGHFTEFLILSLLYCMLRRHMPEKFRNQCMLLAPFAGLLTAVIDEFIQSFTGRGSLVSDVLIDFSGVMTAVILFFIFSNTKVGQHDS